MRHPWLPRFLAVALTVGVVGCAGQPPGPPVANAPPVTVPTAVKPSRPAALPAAQVGRASWYGEAHHGRVTASGEVFDMHQMTAAHPTLPLGSRARVTNLTNGRSVDVLVNDRGPVIPGRIIDLSYAAANALGAVSAGIVRVRVVPLPK
jgi:rare lipoprotein A